MGWYSSALVPRALPGLLPASYSVGPGLWAVATQYVSFSSQQAARATLPNLRSTQVASADIALAKANHMAKPGVSRERMLHCPGVGEDGGGKEDLVNNTEVSLSQLKEAAPWTRRCLGVWVPGAGTKCQRNDDAGTWGSLDTEHTDSAVSLPAGRLFSPCSLPSEEQHVVDLAPLTRSLVPPERGLCKANVSCPGSSTVLVMGN